MSVMFGLRAVRIPALLVVAILWPGLVCAAGPADEAELIPGFAEMADSVRMDSIKAYMRSPKVWRDAASKKAGIRRMIALCQQEQFFQGEAYSYYRLYNVFRWPADDDSLTVVETLIREKYYDALGCNYQMRHLLDIGYNYGEAEQPDEAQLKFHRALALCDSCALPKGDVYNALALVNNWLGKDSLALEYMLLSVNEILKADKVNQNRLRLLYNNISNQYSQLAQHDSALVYAERGLAMGRHPRALIRHANLVMRDPDQYLLAEQEILEAAALIRENPNYQRYEITVLIVQSRLYGRMGRHTEARRSGERALKAATTGPVNHFTIQAAYASVIQALLEEDAPLIDSLLVHVNKLNNEKVQATTLKEQARFQTLQKENEILALNGQLKDKEIETLQFRNYLVYGGVAVLVIGLLVYFGLRRRQVRARRELDKLRKQAVKLQMNPHFFFNSLNSIQLFIAKNEKGLAQKYLVNFSKLMRLTLENSQEETIPIGKEIDFLHNYLVLEQLRMKNFDFEFEVPEELKELRIPGLLIQPLVENSLLHGFADIPYRGLLRISIVREGASLRIEVVDNGIGKENAQAIQVRKEEGHKSFALSILQKRLANYAQQADEIVYTTGIATAGNPGTKVAFHFPVL